MARARQRAEARVHGAQEGGEGGGMLLILTHVWAFLAGGAMGVIVMALVIGGRDDRNR